MNIPLEKKKRKGPVISSKEEMHRTNKYAHIQSSISLSEIQNKTSRPHFFIYRIGKYLQK